MRPTSERVCSHAGRARSSGFLPSRGAVCSICTSFASDRVALFFGTRTCGRVEGGAPSASISHEKRGRIPSQSDNPAACPACPARSALFTSSRRVIRENCGPFRVKRMQQQPRPPSSFVDVRISFSSARVRLRQSE